jgi:hypothetical protein
VLRLSPIALIILPSILLSIPNSVNVKPPVMLASPFLGISDIKFSSPENSSELEDCRLEIEILDMEILLVN